MKVILLKDVAKVGRKYDIKNVADGFAQNMLIPRGLAQIATPSLVQKIETMKALDLTQKKIQDELLLKSLEAVKNVRLILKEKANEKGHLFAGVTKEMLVSELHKSAKLNVPVDAIKLDKPLKEIGEHKVTLEVSGKKADFTVTLQAL